METTRLAPPPGAAGEGFAPVEGYASVWGAVDGGGDVVEPGAARASLARLKAAGGRVRMLWQHDPREPIGVWDEVREDERGLWVRGRLLLSLDRGREAAALLAAGAIDGLSIGYRTVRAAKDAQGRRRLHEIDLWEVSLVTFPMLPAARTEPALGAGAGAAKSHPLRTLRRAVAAARARL